MKNKTLLIFLIFCMLVSSLPAFASDYEKNKTTYLEILHEIGLMDDNLFARLKESNLMTRADYIQILMNVMSNDEKEYSNSPFDDVGNSNKAFNSICAGYEYKIISGDENKLFNPTSAITYNAAVKFSAAALGYSEIAELEGGYPAGYLKIASMLDLERGVEVSNERLLPGAAARLLYNTIMADVNGVSVNLNKNGGYSMGPVKGESLIWSKKKIRVKRGVLKSNSFTSLSGTDGLSENEISIDDFCGYCYHSTAAEDYLGYEVDCYYRVNDDEENIVAAIIPTYNNAVLKISAEEFVEANDNRIRYIKNDSNKEKIIKFSGNAMVIYNGKAKPDYTMEDFDISAGDIVLIDNNQDNAADVISIHSYNDYLINGLDNNNFVIYDKYKKSLDLSTEDGESVIITDISGNILSFDDLKSNMVLTAMINDDYIRAVASEAIVGGKIEEIHREDEDTYIIVDKTKYFLSADYPVERISDFELGKKADMPINVFGHIAGINTAPKMWEYGYIIKTYYEDENDKLIVKLMDVYGVIHKYALAKKFKIDGQRYNSNEDNLMSVPANNMVLFELNNLSEIAKLETPDGEKLHATADKTSLAFDGGPMWFDGLLPVTATTPIFVCPPASKTDACDEDYFVTTTTYLAGVKYVVQGFNTNKSSYIPDVILLEPNTSKKTIKWNGPNIIVKRCYNIINRDDEVTVAISGYDFAAKEVEYELKNKELISGLEINSGDILKLKLNDQGLVEALDKCYDSENHVVPMESMYSGIAIRSSYRPFAAYVYEKNNIMIGFAEDAGRRESSEINYYQYSGATVLLAERGRSDRVTVTKSSIDALRDYVGNGVQSQVFAHSSDGKLKTIIVYQ